jgi:hypothetical protein
MRKGMMFFNEAIPCTFLGKEFNQIFPQAKGKR